MNEPEEPSSTDSEGYSQKQVRHLLDQVRDLRNAQPAVRVDLAHLSEQLTVQRARTFANEALGRRLPVIERTVLNIFDIYPPSRREFLTKDECTDVAIQLHAFAINVYAVLDNVAWVCMLEAEGVLAPAKVSLFKKDCGAFLPPALVDYISQPTIKRWFDEYGKVYRDSTAHRIPPYLPDRSYSWWPSSNQTTSPWPQRKSPSIHASPPTGRRPRTARAQGKRLGRPTVSAGVEARIAELRGEGMGKIKIAKTLGIGVSTVQRVVG